MAHQYPTAADGLSPVLGGTGASEGQEEKVELALGGGWVPGPPEWSRNPHESVTFWYDGVYTEGAS